MKKIILPMLVIAIIAFGVIVAFVSAPEEKKEEIKGASITEIMYFYSDDCAYCIKQKPILDELEKEGVKFKYMDVKENRNYLEQYGIDGTPSFIIGNTKLTGYQNKEKIRELWEKRD